MGLARSTFYDAPEAQRVDEARLVERMREVCAEWPAYGYRRVTAELPLPEEVIMNHDLVRPVRSHMSSWLALRSSTRQAANAPSAPEASSFAWASVDGLEANQESNCLSSLKSAVV